MCVLSALWRRRLLKGFTKRTTVRGAGRRRRQRDPTFSQCIDVFHDRLISPALGYNRSPMECEARARSAHYWTTSDTAARGITRPTMAAC